MDQVKKVFGFIWAYRFWFALGIAVILSVVTYPSGATVLQRKAEAQQKKLDGIHSAIAKFAQGNAHINPQAIAVAEEKKKEITETVETVWERLFREQMPLMTWPEELQTRFGHRPFGADLTDERNMYLNRYFREYFADQVEAIYYKLDPLEVETDGTILGTVDTPLTALRSATFAKVPTSQEAWLAQEHLWVQREIINAIANANEPAMKLPDSAAKWRNAAVKSLVSITMGYTALDTKSMGTAQLIDGMGAAPGAPAAGNPMAQMTMSRPGGKDTNVIPDTMRYLEDGEQYRILPVSVTLQVDQMKIPQVLASLSNAKFNFKISQANLSMPEKPIEIPPPLKEVDVTSNTPGAPMAEVDEDEADELEAKEKIGRDAAFNTMLLQVYGTMRIYKMPPRMVEDYKKAIEEGKFVREPGDIIAPPEEKPAEKPEEASVETPEAPAPAAPETSPPATPPADPSAPAPAAPETSPPATPPADPAAPAPAPTAPSNPPASETPAAPPAQPETKPEETPPEAKEQPKAAPNNEAA